MMFLWIILGVLLFIILLYLWCLKGRWHPDMAKLRCWNYAHRGLHDAVKPENSMAAFRAALESGFGIELDVHLLKDGNLAVIHDSDLERVTGQKGKVEDLVTEQLQNYHLSGTEETIPQFRQVLDLFDGKAPLIVELKTQDNNVVPLCEAACKMLDSYDGLFCVESFDPRVVRWMRKNRPDIVRGQLSENWMPKQMPFPWILKFVMTYHIGNFYTRPNFIAYKFEDRKAFGTWICRKLLGIPGVSWTLKNREEYDIAVKEGWIPIFEGFQLD